MKLIFMLLTVFSVSAALPLNSSYNKNLLTICNKQVDDLNEIIESDNEELEGAYLLNDNLTNTIQLHKIEKEELIKEKGNMESELSISRTNKILYENLHLEKLNKLTACQSLSETLSDDLKTARLVIFTHNFSQEICVNDRIFEDPYLTFLTLQKNPFLFTLIFVPYSIIILFLIRIVLKKLLSCCKATKCKKPSLCAKRKLISCCKTKKIGKKNTTNIEMESYKEIATELPPQTTNDLSTLPSTNPFRPLPLTPNERSIAPEANGNSYDNVNSIDAEIEDY